MKALMFALALAGAAGGVAYAQSSAPPQPPMAHPDAGHADWRAQHPRFEADANHDGYLSRAEAMAAADDMFKRLDADGDGKLTREEFIHRRGPHGGPWEHGAKGRGGAGAEGGMPMGAPPQPGAAQGAPPRDQWDEWPHRMMMMHMMMQMHRAEMRRARVADILFTEYDRNHDGAIELAEFRAYARARFDALDGNRDGKVKLPERRHGPGPDGRRWDPGKWDGGHRDAPPAAPEAPKTP